LIKGYLYRTVYNKKEREKERERKKERKNSKLWIRGKEAVRGRSRRKGSLDVLWIEEMPLGCRKPSSNFYFFNFFFF